VCPNAGSCPCRRLLAVMVCLLDFLASVCPASLAYVSLPSQRLLPGGRALRLILTHALGANIASLFTFHYPLSIFFPLFSFHCPLHFPLFSVQFFSRLDFEVQLRPI
jgi:hypothetical protein